MDNFKADSICEESSVYRLYTEFINASGRQFVDEELMIYMIIELVSGIGYNTILFEQPKPMEDIKPFLHETIYNIIH